MAVGGSNIPPNGRTIRKLIDTGESLLGKEGQEQVSNEY